MPEITVLFTKINYIIYEKDFIFNFDYPYSKQLYC